MITLADIEAARDRIAPFVRTTPSMLATALREPPPVAAEIVFKLELHQVAGSFKARGAMNRFLAADPDAVRRGIVAASGGNHGLAVSRTAAISGVRADIYLPEAVSPAKVERMKAWGANVTIVPGDFDAADTAARRHAEAEGAVYFHAFADPEIVAGQGTLGLEIAAQAGDCDLLVLAIGGGGLAAGVGTAIRALRPGMRILGVEPTGSPTLSRSLEAGEVVTLDRVTSRVPTMSCRRTDPRILATIAATMSGIVLIEDDEMLEAARWLWRECGIAADMAGAAAMAAVRRGGIEFEGARRICVLVCGSGAEGMV